MITGGTHREADMASAATQDIPTQQMGHFDNAEEELPLQLGPKLTTSLDFTPADVEANFPSVASENVQTDVVPAVLSASAVPTPGPASANIDGTNPSTEIVATDNPTTDAFFGDPTSVPLADPAATRDSTEHEAAFSSTVKTEAQASVPSSFPDEGGSQYLDINDQGNHDTSISSLPPLPALPITDPEQRVAASVDLKEGCTVALDPTTHTAELKVEDSPPEMSSVATAVITAPSQIVYERNASDARLEDTAAIPGSETALKSAASEIQMPSLDDTQLQPSHLEPVSPDTPAVAAMDTSMVQDSGLGSENDASEAMADATSAVESSTGSAVTSTTPAKSKLSGTKRSATSNGKTSVKKKKSIQQGSIFPPFSEMLCKLMAFRCKEKHCRVPARDIPLGPWVSFVRRCFVDRQKGLNVEYLTDERIEILNSIEFTWSLLQCANDRRWESNFDQLVAYKKENGHCNVPQSTPLGKWVQMQRDQYRERQLKESGQQTKRPIISQERIDRLSAIDFSWRVAEPAVGWEGRFQELLNYKAVHGHCNVPQGWKENIQLGRWVMKQRVQYHKKLKGEKSQMTDERIKRLEDIGFGWVGAGKVGKRVGMKDEEGNACIVNEVIADVVNEVNAGVVDEMNTGLLNEVNPGVLTDLNPGVLTGVNTGVLTEVNTTALTDVNTGVLNEANTGVINEVMPLPVAEQQPHRPPSPFYGKTDWEI